MQKKGQKIIFADLCESQFDGNHDDMLDWLNRHNRLKEVIFIAQHGEFLKDGSIPFIVDKYHLSNIINLVLVSMVVGGRGDAKGLIFINDDFVGKEDLGDDDIGIKWYVNGQFVDDEELKKN